MIYETKKHETQRSKPTLRPQQPQLAYTFLTTWKQHQMQATVPSTTPLDPSKCISTVETMRCSRCAMSAETVSHNGRDVSADDARAGGMVKFGHNLYYCDRCAKIVGYNEEIGPRKPDSNGRIMGSNLSEGIIPEMNSI
ncbi:hypothetical protein O988_05599 [Pseudogymnoascus sp. VKM F-3808]|nr:hypothetical protein O988_05599 [Pseudogymnoascus sp. VKM F-3808]